MVGVSLQSSIHAKDHPKENDVSSALLKKERKEGKKYMKEKKEKRKEEE